MDLDAPPPDSRDAASLARLADLRAQIDDTDRKLLRLLDQRIEYALQTARLKPAVTDGSREDDVMTRVRAAAYGLLSDEFVGALYRSIIDESKRLQARRPRFGGFQGEHGAWSEMALDRWDASLIPVACRTFDDVFEGVAAGFVDADNRAMLIVEREPAALFERLASYAPPVVSRWIDAQTS